MFTSIKKIVFNLFHTFCPRTMDSQIKQLEAKKNLNRDFEGDAWRKDFKWSRD